MHQQIKVCRWHWSSQADPGTAIQSILDAPLPAMWQFCQPPSAMISWPGRWYRRCKAGCLHLPEWTIRWHWSRPPPLGSGHFGLTFWTPNCQTYARRGVKHCSSSNGLRQMIPWLRCSPGHITKGPSSTTIGGRRASQFDQWMFPVSASDRFATLDWGSFFSCHCFTQICHLNLTREAPLLLDVSCPCFTQDTFPACGS